LKQLPVPARKKPVKTGLALLFIAVVNICLCTGIHEIMAFCGFFMRPFCKLLGNVLAQFFAQTLA
jgi:ABC-type polysaccharide/polyol phosphate export permease